MLDRRMDLAAITRKNPLPGLDFSISPVNRAISTRHREDLVVGASPGTLCCATRLAWSGLNFEYPRTVGLSLWSRVKAANRSC